MRRRLRSAPTAYSPPLTPAQRQRVDEQMRKWPSQMTSDHLIYFENVMWLHDNSTPQQRAYDCNPEGDY